MGRLSTHVLDTARGRPADGVAVALYRLRADGSRVPVGTAVTNADGRTDEPLLAGPAFEPGTYEMVFDIAPYFRETGGATAAPPFLDAVPIRFTLADPDGHYHVPLLVSPWSYATYRGS